MTAPSTIAHVPMPLATQSSTLMTVVQQLATAAAAHEVSTSVVLSDNRDLHVDGVREIFVDYTRYCPREWFNRPEVAADVALGALGRSRHYHGQLYRPAVDAIAVERPDAVLLYEGHYAAASLPWWRARNPGTKLLLYVHNPLSRTYRRRELRRLLGSVDAVIFCADHLRRDVVRRVGGDAVRLAVVHNGVDPCFLGEYDPLRLDPREPFTIVYAGRLSPKKGVDVLLRAVAAARSVTERKLRVTVIGSANYDAAAPQSEYERMLREMVIKHRLDVRFIPFLDKAELREHYRTASLVCTPSVWAEGFPLVALEAMACGAPIVSSDVYGLREACGDAARYVPMGDQTALARAIADLCVNEEEARRLSRAGWERARQFTWARTAAGIIDVVTAV